MGTTYSFAMPEVDSSEDRHPTLVLIENTVGTIPQGKTEVSYRLTHLPGVCKVIHDITSGYSLYCGESQLQMPKWLADLFDNAGLRITKVFYQENSLPYVAELAPYLGVYTPSDEFRDCLAEVDLTGRGGAVFVDICLTVTPNDEGRMPSLWEFYSLVRTQKLQPDTWHQPIPNHLRRLSQAR